MSVADLLAELRATFPPGQTSGTFEAPAVQGGQYVPLLTGLGIPTTLALTSPDGWAEQDGGVGLIGTVTTKTLELTGVPVTFAFTPAGQGFDLTLTLGLPASWTFSQSFPALAGGSFDELTLATAQPATLTVSSAAAPPGLNFAGTFDRGASLISMLAWLIDEGAPLAVSGPVNYVASAGTVDMTLDLATGSVSDLFGSSGPTLDFQLVLWSGLDEAVEQYSAGVRFTTSLDFGETIDLSALLVGSDQGVLDITLSGSALAFPDPDTLARYFGTDNGIADALPDKFQGGNLVQVDELTFGIGLTTQSLEYAFLAVGALTGQTWPLWQSVIELGDLEFEFRIFDPLDPATATSSFTFGATLTFGSTVPLLVRAQLPADVLTAGLDRTEPPPNLAPYVLHALGDTFGLPEELRIAHFDMSANLGQEAYEGRLEIEGDWSFAFGIDNHVSFEDLLVELGYSTVGGASGDLAARFRVDQNVFDLGFAMTKGNTRITGEWTDRGKPLTYQNIAIALGMYGLPNLPTALDLELTSAHLEFDSAGPSFEFDIGTHSGGAAALLAGKDSQGNWGFVYGMILSLTVSVDLTEIPVIGKLVPTAYDTFALSDLRLVGASTALPVYQPTKQLDKIIGPTVNSGLVLSATLTIGTAVTLPLSVRFGGADDGTADDTPPTGDVLPAVADGGAAPGPQATWVSVQRAFGPVQINRIGLAITPDDEVALLLDASVSLAGLTIGLVGLEAAMPLQSPYTPTFALAGLQVGFSGGAVQISGGLEKVPATPEPEFTGELVVNVAAFGLSVFGSYTTVEGQPSLFVFLFLDAPLGGPAFFFVTGLAGGFGYNRTLKLPTIDEVQSFPLVAGATGQLDAATTETELNARIQPQLGEDWLAAGVRFTSFETLVSFALLTVAFGTHFEVALMGESTISVPPAAAGETVTPTAQAQMVLLVDYAPAQGQLAVCAQLTSASYVLEQAARLTGGFAFYVWFPPSAYASDFVVTLGGYNPYYTPPDHYPKVPRLGLNWKVSDQLTVSGGLYFALTPSVLMAGGEMDASWQSGDISASFVAHADFLMRFKPFQYLIDVDVSITVAVTLDLLVTTKRVTAHASVGVNLWGPPFGGTARVDLSIVSFTMAFGADSPPPLPDLEWPAFRTSFLPPANAAERMGSGMAALDAPTPTDSLVTIAAPQGLVSGAQSPWLVDPTQLVLNVATQVPSTDADVVTTTTSKPSGSWNSQLGIGPMGVAPGDLSSVLKISITRGGEGDPDAWTAVAGTAGVPSGLWQHAGAQMETDGLVPSALTGVTLTPTPQAPARTLPVPLAELAAAEPAVLPFGWSEATVPHSDPFDQATAMQTLQRSLVDPTVAVARTGLLAALRAQGLQTSATVDVACFAAHAPDLLASAPLLRLLGEEPAA